MSETIGSILKRQRQSLKFSQARTAEGICAQSMLSAIENNRYIPNAQLLIALCQRLEIQLNTLSLATNYAISTVPDLNGQLVSLCNQHKYSELLTFLTKKSVLNTIHSQAQTQSYYYYLAVAQAQSTPIPNLTTVKQTLSLSLASATSVQPALTRLTHVSLAYLAAKQNHRTEANAQIQLAIKQIETIPYEANLNIVFYLAALTQYQLGQHQACLKYLLQGIDFITAHDTHFMLANNYYLMAQVAQRSEQLEQSLQAQERSDFLAKLFGESIFKV